jgi:hypothetical protein
MTSDDDISVDRAPGDGAPPPPFPPAPAAESSDIATAEEVSEATNTAEYYYMNGGCCLKVLVAMSHGLRDNNGKPYFLLKAIPGRLSLSSRFARQE